MPVPTFADCLRVVWWLEVGFLYGAKHGHGVSARVLPAVGALLWWPSAPLLLVGQLVSCASPKSVYYLSQERDAVLAVTVRRDGWHLHTHLTSRPGRGRGRALRGTVLPVLLTAADQQAVTLHAVAADRRLVAAFTAEVPGLRDVGPAFPRGQRLRREPERPGPCASPSGG